AAALGWTDGTSSLFVVGRRWTWLRCQRAVKRSTLGPRQLTRRWEALAQAFAVLPAPPHEGPVAAAAPLPGIGGDDGQQVAPAALGLHLRLMAATWDRHGHFDL